MLPSKIFIDGGDPAETKEADAMLKKAGFSGVEGQTTNPTLIAKKVIRDMQKVISKTESPSNVSPITSHISPDEALSFYRKTVEEMAKVTKGAISIQVIGDPATLTTEEMLHQARDRILWIPNGVIKFPCTREGLKAAEIFCQEGPVNITLAFSQEQAAAVYSATKSHNFDVYVSPFVGRLDDKGEKGMDVVANILAMYRKFGRASPEAMTAARDGHVKVLTASVRTIEHIKYALWLKSECITVPFKLLAEWANQGYPQPSSDYFYDAPGLTEIPYRELSLDKDWTEFDLHHELTDIGLKKFWEDWKNITRET